MSTVTDTSVLDQPADEPALSRPRTDTASRHARANVRPVHRPRDPRWVTPSLIALLAATGVLYLWGLGASGYANSFYSAAVQAGSESWKAFFFGSFDAANLITVDKPPASLWVMDLSARVFGVNSWSILVPQALEGVAAVWLLFLTVRRWYGGVAGLLAGAILATTPVAALMFRFNNPDALLVLLLVGAAYAMTRAIEAGGTRWLVLAGTLIGFAFLTKMLQAFVVVPGFALVYLLAAPVALRKRLWQLIVAGLAIVVSAGWWVAIVELWPASSRPYIGGSQDNSILELVLGYNGLGRITGNETGSVGGGGQGGGMWGETGWDRMFNASFGGQISWLIPTALLLAVATLVLWRRAPRTDVRRAGVLLWGSWLVVTWLTFSYAQGIIHEYYSVALAPAIGALVGIGATTFWRVRRLWQARAVLCAAVLVTTWWSAVLLGRSADFQPWVRWSVIVLGLASAVALLVPVRVYARAGAVVVLAALFAGLAGPVAYAVQTASVPHSGSLPTAGPSVSGGGRGPGGMGGPGAGRFGGQSNAQAPNGQLPNGALPNGALPNVQGGVPGLPGPSTGQGFGGNAFPGAPPGGFGSQGGQGRAPNGQSFGGGGAGGGLGGLLDATTPSSELVTLLTRDADEYVWVAAAVGSNNAAGAQLATGRPVMSIGGFNGTDPAPTLEQFQQYVASGKVHYFLGGGGIGGAGMNGSSASSEIAAWVEQNFAATTVGGTTVYDLTQPSASTSTTGSAPVTGV